MGEGREELTHCARMSTFLQHYQGVVVANLSYRYFGTLALHGFQLTLITMLVQMMDATSPDEEGLRNSTINDDDDKSVWNMPAAPFRLTPCPKPQ